MGCIDFYLHGQVDYDRYSQKAREHAPVLAGAFLELGGGAGWVATLALIVMNLVSRDELANMTEYLSGADDGAETRAKVLLLLSYFMAFGSVAGSIAVLVQCVQAKHNVEVGVGGLLQCGFILLSALLFWAFRTDENGNYGLIY